MKADTPTSSEPNGAGSVKYHPYQSGEPAQFQAAAAPAAPPQSQPSKRAKGRFFVGALLLGTVTFVGYQIWNSFLRYEAYGTVDGRVVEVSGPWDGEVQTIHVREGEHVRQGDLLVTLDSITLRHELSQLHEELDIGLAALEAEVVRLKWQAQMHDDRRRETIARYYETWGELLREQAVLNELKDKAGRAIELGHRKAISRGDMESSKLAKEGQARMVEKLSSAVEVLENQSGSASDWVKEGLVQLRPGIARSESLSARIQRLRERLDQGMLRAPIDGIVIKRHRPIGEHVKEFEPIVSILAESSLHVMLYVPQRESAQFETGSEVRLKFEPYRKPLRCTVLEIGDQYVPAPVQIQRHYLANQLVLPIRLVPRDSEEAGLRLGATVKLPVRWQSNPLGTVRW